MEFELLEAIVLLNAIDEHGLKYGDLAPLLRFMATKGWKSNLSLPMERPRLWSH